MFAPGEPPVDEAEGAAGSLDQAFVAAVLGGPGLLTPAPDLERPARSHASSLGVVVATHAGRSIFAASLEHVSRPGGLVLTERDQDGGCAFRVFGLDGHLCDSLGDGRVELPSLFWCLGHVATPDGAGEHG